MNEDKRILDTANLLLRRALVAHPIGDARLDLQLRGEFSRLSLMTDKPRGAKITYIFGGSIFHIAAAAIVNPVNTKGAAGRGLAAEFRSRFPQGFKLYKQACAEGRVKIGEIYVQVTGGSPGYIFNFPTKDDWRDPSQLDYITLGLEDMAKQMATLGVDRVAMPAVGCGLGGLDWLEVVDEIEDVLGTDRNLLHKSVYVFAPRAGKSEIEKEQEKVSE